MPVPIQIVIGDREFPAELNDSGTSRTLQSMLPLEFTMSRWGDEYYGDCGIKAAVADDAKDIMEVGELAVWTFGSAFCIFFGPTPASKGSEPRAASPVNPVGKLKSDPSLLNELGSSIEVRLDLQNK